MGQQRRARADLLGRGAAEVRCQAQPGLILCRALTGAGTGSDPLQRAERAAAALRPAARGVDQGTWRRLGLPDALEVSEALDQAGEVGVQARGTLEVRSIDAHAEQTPEQEA